eukprot:1017048-Pleurochrysis_carterae.AAC.1
MQHAQAVFFNLYTPYTMDSPSPVAPTFTFPTLPAPASAAGPTMRSGGAAPGAAPVENNGGLIFLGIGIHLGLPCYPVSLFPTCITIPYPDTITLCVRALRLKLRELSLPNFLPDGIRFSLRHVFFCMFARLSGSYIVR